MFALMFTLGACADHAERSLGVRDDALAVPGPWQIPDDVLRAGDTQYVPYEGAGEWVDEASCAGGLRPGTRIVGDYLAQRFPQISKVGGYACRPIRGGSTTMSLHGAGRALDLHIPTVPPDNDADNDLGDEVGHFLIAHAELFGVQLIIWDEWSWGASRAEGAKGRMYTGVNPHRDHLHIELSVAASERTSDWFREALNEGDAGSDPDLGSELDAGEGVAVDAGAASDAGSLPVVPPGEKPRPLRPVIEPILDDDPLPADELPPADEVDTSTEPVGASYVRGEGLCAVRPKASSNRALLVWSLGVAGAFVRRRRGSAPRR